MPPTPVHFVIVISGKKKLPNTINGPCILSLLGEICATVSLCMHSSMCHRELKELGMHATTYSLTTHAGSKMVIIMISMHSVALAVWIIVWTKGYYACTP